jgi:hypothetical protein
VDSRKADTIEARHILITIAQSDSSATRTDRRADSLASKAANQEDPKVFDATAKALGITPSSCGDREGAAVVRRTLRAERERVGLLRRARG